MTEQYNFDFGVIFTISPGALSHVKLRKMGYLSFLLKKKFYLHLGLSLILTFILVLLVLTWFMVSMQLTAVLYGMSGQLAAVFGNAQDWLTFLLSIRWPMVAAFLTTGTIAAIAAFVLSVVAIPMLTEEEEMDVITAMVTSWHAVKANGDAMLVWAMIIGFLTALAVAPLFLGLIVVFPLLGYASWHAYQDLIEH